MIGFERRQNILRILAEKPGIRVTQLAEQLAVSEGTIRNDLTALEEEQQVRRVRGGAVLVEPETPLPGMSQVVNAEAKQRIARWAAEMVEEGSTILLDASTTVQFMIPHLREHQRLTIVTNGLETARQVARTTSHTVVLVGGMLNRSGNASTGLLGLEMLKNMHIHAAYVSAVGSDFEAGLTERHIEEAQLKEAMLCKIGNWTLTGSERMQQRPIGELVNTLRKLGANIAYLNKEGFPPLKIVGSKLNGGAVEIDGSVSSQFITALLLIAPSLESGLTLQIKNESVSKPYIKMTIEVMNQFGVAVEQICNVIKVPSAHYKKDGLDYYVESDWSSASYWYSFVALADEAKVTLRNFNKSSFQSDSIVQSLYEKLGVKTHWDATGITLTKQASSISELQYDFLDCPDIAQTVAATCVGLGLKAHLTGLQTLPI